MTLPIPLFYYMVCFLACHFHIPDEASLRCTRVPLHGCYVLILISFFTCLIVCLRRYRLPWAVSPGYSFFPLFLKPDRATLSYYQPLCTII
ncbi:hypothetical protein BJX66DRAFT_65428 [Aspergillus keveii]|uniref:Uncharacterized protein n=1 Tax=Aspergillus keveii TaxID=714993 RepID=A0ABR4GGS8_9EURO